ncbi:MBL fold metallo-hydrolase [Flexivirga oryzae]|uniref:Glyoxylase-like metal-dependent hydrolase (Beta-lactamase superfamily II) n=1 Tax=Flexivirga oryzae TaxID=1794944 RepID=A0A839N9Z3_9MICO|nr:glyoxylase-like metal-dependent hydrolase (beta-lactamase superfamily II) [Flexivirga oryzae]
MPTNTEGHEGSGPWTDEVVEQAAPGVFRIPLPLPEDGLRAINVYVLRHGDRATLIDSGWSFGPGQQVLERGLAQLDLDLGQIDRVLVTHMHRDHYTLAIRLRSLLGTRVLIGAGERESIEAAVDGAGSGVEDPWLSRWGAHELRPLLAARPPRPTSEYGLPDEWIDAPTDFAVGDRTLRAVPTPGHTRGHLVFLDEQAGLLFAGDHVLPRITPSIGLEVPRDPLALAAFLESLQVVRQLPDLAVLPAHGALGARSHRRADELAEHHRLRLDATAEAVGGGATTVYEVARALTWTRHEKHFAELDAGNQYLAVAETAAHLAVLVRDGVLADGRADGVDTYRAAAAAPSAARGETN